MSGRTTALLEIAERLLDEVDARRRTRKDGALARFDKTPLETQGELVSAVRTVVASFHEEMLKDREEIQALWWVFGGYSFRGHKSFRELEKGTAAVMAGIELAEIIAPPATRGLAALASRATRAAHDAENALPIPELLQSVSNDGWHALKPTPSISEYVRNHSGLLPISAVALHRRSDTPLEETLRHHCLLNVAGANLTATELAAQVFAERSLLAAVSIR